MSDFVVITGANGGIGQETSRYLHSKGLSLLLIDLEFDSAFLNSFQDESEVQFKAIDLTDDDSIQQLAEFVDNLAGNIIGLVHLAGIIQDRSLLKMTLEQWNAVIEINLTGTFRSLQLCAEKMVETGGSIVLTGSTAARHGNFGQANYVASKAGVEGLTRTSARELAKSDIRVNCILPGFIKTQMTDTIPDKYRQQIINQIPLKRAGNPIDVAKVIFFLLSDESSYITGQSILIDGGLRM